MHEKIALYSPPLDMQKYTSYFELVDAAVEFGIKNIETINGHELKTPNLEFAKRLREYADKKGVKIVCCSVGIDLVGDGNEVNIEKVMSYAEGAKIVCITRLHLILPTLTEPKRIEKFTLIGE